MAVKKINGFASPYRSKTLRDEKNVIAESNGVLSLSGQISQAGNIVTLPQFSFIQQGLIVEVDSSKNITVPTGYLPPFFLTVHSPSPSQTDDLIFRFPKSPSDISSTDVIIAEHDGTEWRIKPFISLYGIVADIAQTVLDKKENGAYNGLLTTDTGATLTNSSGLLFDGLGEKKKFNTPYVVQKIPADPDAALRRVDRIVYRRSTDFNNRVGARKLIAGGTYYQGGRLLSLGAACNPTPSINSKAIAAVNPDNTSFIVWADGYGENYSLKLSKVDQDRVTYLISGVVVTVSTSNSFDIVSDVNGNLHIVYQNADNINLLGITPSGTTLYGPLVIDGLANPCSKPKICTDEAGMFLYIAFEYLAAPMLPEVRFTSRRTDGALVKSPVKISTMVGSASNPDIAISSDLYPNVCFESSGNIYHVVLNDSSLIDSHKVVSNGTTHGASVLSGGASKPQISITDNKVVFISFLQNTILGSTPNVAIYDSKTSTSYMPDVLTGGQYVESFSMYADSFDNDVHIATCVKFLDGNFSHYFLCNNKEVLYKNKEYLNNATKNESVFITKDICGSLIHLASKSDNSGLQSKGAATTLEYAGPIAISGTLNPMVLLSNQISVPVSYPVVPVAGDKVVISGSGAGNNGTFAILSVQFFSRDTVNDTRILTLDTTTSSESGVASIQFFSPVNTDILLYKTTCELNETRALRMQVMESDTLLSRISYPGPIILNYIPEGWGGANSDLYGMYGSIDVDWSASTAGSFTMSTGLKIIDLVNVITYTVAPGVFPMEEGDAIFVNLDGTNAAVTPQVIKITSLPWNLPIQVLGFVKDGNFNPHLFSVAGMGELDIGEQIVLGQDLSKTIRIRLGILGETSMQSYPSANVISASDNYATAIGKLDEAVSQFGLDVPEEEVFETSAAQDEFTISAIEHWNASNSFKEITVTINGQKWTQDATGIKVGLFFHKLSSTTIKTHTMVPAESVVVIRKERTGAAPVGDGVDLTNVSVDIQPDTNNVRSLGSTAKGYKAVYFSDLATGNVYKASVNNGNFQLELVP